MQLTSEEIEDPMTEIKYLFQSNRSYLMNHIQKWKMNVENRLDQLPLSPI